MYVVIWEFEVKPEHRAEFERHYSGSGSWAQLFRKDPAYQHTQLLRDGRSPLRFLTVDTWQSEAAYRAFKEREHAEYQRLDAAFEAFTQSERLIGTFEVVE